MTTKIGNTESYIEAFPTEVRQILQTIRSAVVKAAPDAVESISYGIPTYKINNRPLVYFAAFKKHIGFYALPSGNAAFQKELAGYKTGKGSVQFPLDKPIPLSLITNIVAYRVKEIASDSSKKK